MNGYAWYYALLGVHDSVLASVALLSFAVLLVLRKVSKRGICLLLAFFILLLLEGLQLSSEGFRMDVHSPDFGVTWERYFGAISPLLWLCSAYGIVKLVGMTKFWWLKTLSVLVVLVGIIYQACVGIGYLYDEYSVGNGRDAMLAGERIAPTIRRDYKGPKRYENFPYSMSEYYTARRPVVVGFWGCAAWAVRGQSQGVAPGYPFEDDYLFARVDDRFRSGLGVALEKMPDHRFVREVKGTVYRWRLYKRIASQRNSGKKK